MSTLKRKNADGTWEYIQVSGLDVSQLKDEVDSVTTSLADIATTVKSYGAKGDMTTDDTTFIQNAVNDVSAQGGGTVYLMRKHLINGTISVPSNITIKSLTQTTIKSTSTNAVFSFQANADNVGIEGVKWDYGSTNSNYAIYVYENVTNIKLKNLKFKNFYNGNPTVQQNVVHLKTGITGSIDDLSFSNIKSIGNGTITDNGGAGRCIRTDYFGVSVYKNYSLNINNIRIDDCYNVDSNGNMIIEDFDPIHFQHFSYVDGFINLSNVTAKNFSKRLIKIQGDGVNISNINAESTIYVPWLIAAMAKNTNISGIVAKGNIKTVVEFLDANNVNVSNVQINSSYVGSTVYDNLFNIYNSSNINISQVSGNGYGGFLIYGNTSENISVDKVNLTLSAQILFVQDRNADNTAYTTGKISNINFTRVSFKVLSTTYNSPLFDINGLGSVNPIQQLQFRDMRLSTNQYYSFGMLRVKNATDVFFDNLYIENNSALSNPTLVSLDGNATVQMRKLSIKGTATTKEVYVLTSANLLLTRSSITNALLSTTATKLELEKTPNVTMTYSSGATSAQLTTT
jgi:hypothetical protein